MKILYATSEARPFAASGGLADVAGSLPKALKSRRIACRVVMPLYAGISEEIRNRMKYITNFDVPVAWRNQYCGLFSINMDNVIYYFIDNEYYFKRDSLYGYYDDAERFSFFSRAVIEMIRHTNWTPDVIHCNDWQTALTPVFLNCFYRHEEIFSNIKTVFTVHNLQYQGQYGYAVLDEVVGINRENHNILDYNLCVNFVKGAMQCCDMITTVSPTYAKEICTPWFSHSLDRFLLDNQYKLAGILNGIDYQEYNPAKDKDIAVNFTSEDFSGKSECKKALLKDFGLDSNAGAPVVGIVSRLVSHKGIDLVRSAFDQIIAEGFKVIILGTGDSEYEHFFADMALRYPFSVAATIGFIPAAAKKIYAGADIFLMPSKSEPCGLAQMISLRYGTIPVVRETGGLADSVFDCSKGQGNGLTFQSYTPEEMMNALHRAKAIYNDKENWKKLVRYAMECDYSWNTSATEYIKMYKSL
ncbi:MAG: glycogen synthase GlgA [Oscillospiraceae bacterium]|nr:glycogen synthase GlgA [Oscillospiraceae bacterium]